MTVKMLKLYNLCAIIATVTWNWNC